jgi:hypothetical protein
MLSNTSVNKESKITSVVSNAELVDSSTAAYNNSVVKFSNIQHDDYLLFRDNNGGSMEALEEAIPTPSKKERIEKFGIDCCEKVHYFGWYACSCVRSINTYNIGRWVENM